MSVEQTGDWPAFSGELAGLATHLFRQASQNHLMARINFGRQ